MHSTFRTRQANSEQVALHSGQTLSLVLSIGAGLLTLAAWP